MERLTDRRFKPRTRAAAGLAVLLMGGCGIGSGGEGSSSDAPVAASASAAGGTSGLGEHTTPPAATHTTRPATHSPTHATRPTTHPATHATSPALIKELVDNHNGAPVFADNTGRPVAGDLPGRIPYGTEVPVECYEENAAGMASVSAFYVIGGGKWAGNVVVADVMTNGGPLGNTNTPNIDPAVPAC